MASHPSLFTAFLLFICTALFLIASTSSSQNVTLSLYYETLCPYCADFIVNHLVKVFDKGLISIVNLRLIPWGNAFIQPNGSFVCQVSTAIIFCFLEVNSMFWFTFFYGGGVENIAAWYEWMFPKCYRSLHCNHLPWCGKLTLSKSISQ